MTQQAHPPIPVAFVLPGDPATLSGGYRYDARVIEGLGRRGWAVEVVRLGDSFPHPHVQDMADATRQLASIAPTTPVIIDGLALGAFDSAVLDAITAPVIALVHHPLAAEGHLSDTRRAELLASERKNLARVGHVIVTSPHTRDLLQSDYGVEATRITVIPPGVDRPRHKTLTADPPLIVSVGNYVPRKGHDVLLEALSRITHIPWQAVIVGGRHDENYSQALEDLCSQYRLTERVSLAGVVVDDELERLYCAASVFALATRFEGHGMVFDEALVHGLPIVTCETSAVSDTVPRDAGLLVPVDDAEAFARALETVLTDQAVAAAMARASMHSGQRRPAWTETVTAVNAVVHAVIDSSHELPPADEGDR